MLFTKRQEVIYTVFNWSAMQDSRVNVIAISNTLDLFERSLSQRISSRVVSISCFKLLIFFLGIKTIMLSAV